MESSNMSGVETAAAAASAAVAKGAGGAAIGGAAVAGLTLSAAVVMMVKQPRTAREWAVALISTIVCSLGLGAFAVLHFGLHKALGSNDQSEVIFALMELGGVMFASGLPGWVLVRIAFNTMSKYQDKAGDDIYRDAKELLP